MFPPTICLVSDGGSPGEFAGMETEAQVIAKVRTELGEEAAAALSAALAKFAPETP